MKLFTSDPATNQKRKLLIVALLLVAIPVTVFVVQQITYYFSRAAVTTYQAGISFSPNNPTISSATNIAVRIDPKSLPLAYASFTVSFDKTKLRLTQNPTTSSLMSMSHEVTTAAIANTTGQINIAVGVGTDQIASAPTQPFTLATLSFEPVQPMGQNISTPLTFSEVQLVNLASAELTTEITNATATINPSAPSANSIPFTITGFPSSIAVGDTFPVSIIMNANSQSIVGSNLSIRFDPTKLSVVSVEKKLFNKNVDEQINNAIGAYSIALHVDADAPPITSSTAEILTLSMRAKAAGSSTISIDPSSVVAGTGASGENLTITSSPQTIVIGSPTSPTAIPTAVPTATPRPTNTPTPRPTATPIPTPTATPRPTATPVPTTTPTRAPTATPQPTVTPRPTVAATPIPTAVSVRREDINQDSVVNIIDYVLFFENYGRTNPTVARADINTDGIVNSRDYALLYQAIE